MNLIHDLVVVIPKACPPVRREEVLGIQEIEQWFDSDPEAPVILYSEPHEARSCEDRPQVQIPINQNDRADARFRMVRQTGHHA